MQQIYKRFLKRECTPSELEILFQYFETSNEEQLRALIISVLSEEDDKESELDIERREKLDLLQGLIEGKIFPSKPAILKWKYVAYAASAAILLFAAVTTIYNYKKADVTEVKYAKDSSADRNPGIHSATLTLADGRKIDLSTVTDEQLARDAGMVIQKTEDGKLIYNLTHNTESTKSTNTLSTARGQTYQVVLPDNTKVWLNASSSITYSTLVEEAGSSRKVVLSGEAYFEVAKDKSRPFIVQVNGQEIKVLGTAFNVKSTKNTAQVETTLIEGSVEVKNNAYIRRLSPGEQAISNHNIIVRKANIARALAWKNGLFYLDEEPLASIMEKVAQWYDVEVAYEGKFRNVHYGGEISRNKKLSDILKVLETEYVHFKLEERRLTVMYK